VTSLDETVVCRRNLVDIFYHIRQTAAPVAKLVLGFIWGTHFGVRGGRSGSAMIPFKRVMVVSYRSSTETIALSLTIQPQFAI